MSDLKTIKNTVFIVILTCWSTMVLAVPGPDPGGPTCNTLNIEVQNNTGFTCTLKEITINEGQTNGLSNGQTFDSGSSLVGSADMIPDGTYGPDITLHISCGKGSAVIHMQQDFCFLEAGDITANTISNQDLAVDVSSKSGSYEQTPGSVTWKLSSPQ